MINKLTTLLKFKTGIFFSLLILYVLFELSLSMVNSCAVCHPVGHAIALLFFVLIFLILKKSFLLIQHAKSEIFRNVAILGLSILIMIIFILTDLGLAINGITMEGGLF